MSVEALIDFFPTATLERICTRKGVTPPLRQWVLVTEVGGYNCYARLGAAAKHNACKFIKRHGPLVHASKNNAIFSTGTISCPLVVTLSSLLNAGVEVCVLEAFGMKSDMNNWQKCRWTSPLWRKELIPAFLPVVREFHCSPV